MLIKMKVFRVTKLMTMLAMVMTMMMTMIVTMMTMMMIVNELKGELTNLPPLVRTQSRLGHLFVLPSKHYNTIL